MEKKKIGNRNFTMVVIGQIISLFGNAILRFALPLYLLNQTGSAVLFGAVSACAFIPMIIFSPIGGIFADRVNKRNIMVILDFSTSALVLILTLLLGKVNLIALLLSALILLYGIQGAYQPSVQASIPILLPEEQIMQGNAVINMVSSLSGLLGPVIGGAMYGFYGIKVILYISMICFLISAIMEIFIRIPHEKKHAEGNLFVIGIHDMRESLRYMSKKQPVIMILSLAVALINLLISALIMIGLPVIVTQLLTFDAQTANRLYGYAEGIMAAGSLCGGMAAGIMANKIKIRNAYLILFYDALTLIPMGIALLLPIPAMSSYLIIMVSCFVMMLLATLFSVQLMSYLQMIVPEHLIGKVISCALCIGMCATPLGQAAYGVLFELMGQNVYLLFFGVTVLLGLFALALRGTFVKVEKSVKESHA